MSDEKTSSAFSGPTWLAGVIAAFLIGSTIISWLLSFVDPTSTLVITVTLANLILAPVVAIFLARFRASWRATQTGLNASANAIVRYDAPSTLYLRPFVTSGQMKVPNAWPHLGQRVLQGDPWDLELALATILDRNAPVVAIGDTAKGFGAAKIVTGNETWQAELTRLADDAALIIAVPLDRPSTLWEMNQLNANPAWRDKSVFVMPKSSHFYDFFLFPFRKSIAARWRASRKALKQEGIHLPRYRHRGGFFVLGENGETSKLASFRSFRRDYVLSLLMDQSAIGGVNPDRVARFNRNWGGFRPHMPRLLAGWSLYGYFNPYVFKVLALLIIAAVGSRLTYQMYRIPSGSMQPTLVAGDYFATNKWVYGLGKHTFAPFIELPSEGRMGGAPPRRGDVIVFRPLGERRDFAKRIVGLPGERIRITDSILYINDRVVAREPLGERRVQRERGWTDNGPTYEWVPVPAFREILPGGASHVIYDEFADGEYDNTGTFDVPPNHYFVLGDDRDNSQDSRTLVIGYVPSENIIGRVDAVLWSYDRDAVWFKPWTLVTSFRTDRFARAVD